MEKVMILQPIIGKTDDEILKTKNRAINTLKEKGYEIVTTLPTDEYYSEEKMKKLETSKAPLPFISNHLGSMLLCNIVYFCKGWEQTIECKIEHNVAKDYGLNIIYEK